ncbi:hypothetical protein BDA96_05G094000 [Sorghum bicolor]|jgi:hypothetical protein|uniref:Uncharacterized protein n=1 Tax=Sorghum bicolor TaxID=4558 RepID=A0A921QWU5_SORBI|nr:hypothetical protein BDA96_05G094000 [Sorghum bicolor]
MAMERDRQEAVSNWWPVAGQKGLQYMQEPMLLLAGLPFQPWHPAPHAGLLWLPALALVAGLRVGRRTNRILCAVTEVQTRAASRK